jgi:putative DNA primase/helicase
VALVPRLTCSSPPSCAIAQWLVWKFEPKKGQEKPAKMPYYADGGRRHGKQGSDEGSRAPGELRGARVKAAPAEGKGGIGFAFLPGDGLIGIDLDGMIDLAPARSRSAAATSSRPATASPSTRPRARACTSTCLGESATFKKNEIGVEVFCGRQFFTVTGKHYAARLRR